MPMHFNDRFGPAASPNEVTLDDAYVKFRPTLRFEGPGPRARI